MAEERGGFRFGDVVDAICEKMIRRHPHVFSEADLGDEAAVRANWEREKAAERRRKRRDDAPHGVLDGVARALPALVRAEKLQRRAARVGFDWDGHEGVMDKVREELDECAAAGSDDERVHEIGDLLFACVNLARHLNVDAEQALRAASHRFERRFRFVEEGLARRGLAPDREHRDEMEGLWQAAKGRMAGDG
jgi:MazG family protein